MLDKSSSFPVFWSSDPFTAVCLQLRTILGRRLCTHLDHQDSLDPPLAMISENGVRDMHPNSNPRLGEGFVTTWMSLEKTPESPPR